MQSLRDTAHDMLEDNEIMTCFCRSTLEHSSQKERFAKWHKFLADR
jgi:hypothetical protein